MAIGIVLLAAVFAFPATSAEPRTGTGVATARTRPLLAAYLPALSPPLPGGTNYLWYRLDAGCNREPYGIVANYQVADVRAQVRTQLAAMYAAGMRRLSIGVNFAHGFRDGSLIDSSDPIQVDLAAQNVADFLADIRAAGFYSVLFRFFPNGTISPPDANYDTSLVNEHFNLIQAIRASLVQSGLPYLIDLSVEGAPRDSDLPLVSDPWKYPDDGKWSYGVRALWQLYYAAYGAQDTIGFSFITDDDADKMRSRVRHMRYVYEGRYPGIFAVDIYGDASADEAVKFRQFDTSMKAEDGNGALGWRNAGIVVAETYYDDAVAAENIGRAMLDAGRRVYFLTQWPLDRGAGAATGGDCAAVNVAPPFVWDIFHYYGF